MRKAIVQNGVATAVVEPGAYRADEHESLPDIPEGFFAGDLFDGSVWSHPAASLEDQKTRRLAAIDEKSKALFSGGFAWDGKAFSLSAAAQGNANAVLTELSGLPNETPLSGNVRISTADGLFHAFQTAGEFRTYWTVGSGRVREIYHGGQDLRAAIIAAATQEELDAIEDTRV